MNWNILDEQRHYEDDTDAETDGCEVVNESDSPAWELHESLPAGDELLQRVEDYLDS